MPTTKCDYLVIGAGATALAFCDSLLLNLQAQQAEGSSVTTPMPSIVMIDPHDRPGGQWIDSYPFVQLHQPSAMYGVESLALEPTPESASTHRATRDEILMYYEQVIQKWHPYITFVGGATFDFNTLSSLDPTARCYYYSRDGVPCEIRVRKKVVDARYLQPDLPVDTPPRFGFDPKKIHCVPVNDLVTMAGCDRATPRNNYVVIGGGKTGMDAVYYLLNEKKVTPDHIVWIMPHDAWITARESIGNCMEFLHMALMKARKAVQAEKDLVKYVQTSSQCLQDAFLQWEKEGKVYRLDPNILPTKFKDATLSQQELTTLRTVSNVIRGRGRVTKIADTGDLHFEDGSSIALPWQERCTNTTFVHCSAGAFNYTKQPQERPPIFTDTFLTIQDVYGTPGFCFVGSIMGKLESMSNLSNAQKNSLCLAPSPAGAPPSVLGPSGGDIGVLSPTHGFVERLHNLREWLKVPELRDWLVGHRLFNLGHYYSYQIIQKMVEEAWTIALLSELVKESA